MLAAPALQQQGLIRHLGLGTVNAEQVAEAQAIAPVVCVQNFSNIANRDDPLVDALAAQGVGSGKTKGNFRFCTQRLRKNDTGGHYLNPYVFVEPFFLNGGRWLPDAR